MKIIFITLLLSFIMLSSLAQTVTLEPGKSLFNQNTSESVEIKSTSAFPLTLRSTQPASGLPFYTNTNMFRGHIQGGVGGMIYSTPANNGHSFWTKNQQRMIIDSVGNVGIGVMQAYYKLSIFNRSNLFIDTLAYFGHQSTYTSIIPLSTPSFRVVFGDNGYISSSTFGYSKRLGIVSDGRLSLNYQSELRLGNSSTVLLIDNSNKVSINPITAGLIFFPAKADLDVNGTIRSSELDFEESFSTERRPVFADKDGILRIENLTNLFASYNFSSVFPQNSADDYTKGSGYAYFNTTTSPKTFYLPVNLPNGVKITNVRMYLVDNSASNLSFVLNKNSHVTNIFTSVASAQSSTSNSSITSINSNADETVDNLNNSYYVNISSSGNWTSNTLQFHSLVITYQYQ